MTLSSPLIARPIFSDTNKSNRVRINANKANNWLIESAKIDSNTLTNFPNDVTKPISVDVSFILNDISKINEALSLFEANFDLTLSWYDPRLVFDPKEYGSQRQKFALDAAIAKLAEIWSPGIIIVNMNDNPIRIEPGLYINANGKVVYVQRIKSLIEHKFDLTAFPFDRQKLDIHLVSPKYTHDELSFIQTQESINSSGIRNGVNILGWKLGKIEFEHSLVHGWNGQYLQQFDIEIIINREPFGHLFIIFAPLLLAMFVPTVMTLYAKIELEKRMTPWAGSVLALIALNFTLSVRYPVLGSNSLIAKMITLCFGYQLFMIMMTLTVFNNQYIEKMRNKFLALEIAAFARWGVPLGMLTLIVMQTLLTAYS